MQPSVTWAGPACPGDWLLHSEERWLLWHCCVRTLVMSQKLHKSIRLCFCRCELKYFGQRDISPPPFSIAADSMKTWNRLWQALFLKMSKCWDKFTLKCVTVAQLLFLESIFCCSAGAVGFLCSWDCILTIGREEGHVREGCWICLDATNKKKRSKAYSKICQHMIFTSTMFTYKGHQCISFFIVKKQKSKVTLNVNYVYKWSFLCGNNIILMVK